LSSKGGKFALKVHFVYLFGHLFFGKLKKMKKLQNKKQNFTDNDILKFREVFKESEFNDQEIKELKNHFEEMAWLLVGVWLEKKESLTNTKLCQANQKPKSES
jgi:hypothetical protein